MRRQIIRGILWAAAICIILFGAFVLMLTVSEYQPKSEESVEAQKRRGIARSIYEGDQIELLTWNIGYGGLDASMDSVLVGGKGESETSREQIEANMSGIIELIREQSYDVLFLQEVDREAKRSFGINEAQQLHENLGGTSMFAQNYRCLFVPYPIPGMIGSVNSGIQTLTRLSVKYAERVALNSEHLWPARIWEEKHCLLVTRIPVEESGRELVLINLHMEAYEDSARRQRQMQILTDLMEAEYELGNYVIAGGDFNQVFPDDDFTTYPIRRSEYFKPSKMVSQFYDWRWTFASDRSEPTCRLIDEPYLRRNWWTQLYVMDGYILSPNIELVKIETIQEYFEYSDHNPVSMTVRLKPTELRVQPEAEVGEGSESSDQK